MKTRTIGCFCQYSASARVPPAQSASSIPDNLLAILTADPFQTSWVLFIDRAKISPAPSIWYRLSDSYGI